MSDYSPTYLMTLQETASALRVSVHTIRKWKRQGRLHSLQLCRRLLFRRSDIERLISRTVSEESDNQ
jgi:excisionase family DNA binding protein